MILYLNVLPLSTEYHINNCIKLLLNGINALLSLLKTSKYQNQMFERTAILQKALTIVIYHLDKTFEKSMDGTRTGPTQFKNTPKLDPHKALKYLLFWN